MITTRSTAHYVLVAAAASLITAPAADAYRPAALEQAAYAFWGGRAVATCPDGIATVKQAPYQDDAQADADGWARPGDCTVHLSVYRQFAGRWPADCATLLHEVGHIVGYGHDFTGYGHIMEGNPVVVWSSGFELRRGHRPRRVVAWSGVGTYWCQWYARTHDVRTKGQRENVAYKPVGR